MDEGLLDGPAAMAKFLHIVATEPDVCKVWGGGMLEWGGMIQSS